MVVKYAEAAKSAGVFIIGACGWDSIPADMGVRFLRNNFSGWGQKPYSNQYFDAVLRIRIV
jgi:short subunit dehydrogenase-like uncharacterized protein